MKDCDIDVQPPLTENFCIALREALCFAHFPRCNSLFSAQRNRFAKKDTIIVPADSLGQQAELASC